MLKMVERMKWRRSGSIVAIGCSCDRRDVVRRELRCCLIDILVGTVSRVSNGFSWVTTVRLHHSLSFPKLRPADQDQYARR
jgi:hypothetical protein